MAVLSHLAKQKNFFLTAELKIDDSAGEIWPAWDGYYTIQAGSPLLDCLYILV